ncbi:uncharacterized protein MONOS_18596 [Monocercomonoides exilis]|uniref:uncharacterized protein n=1 Tax=Monocercomonoides exilis TaxID=2049356 RepID=UPI00355ACC3A|nr:hypothetical protein MONOS_18596 [Monocercomonoides exilis]
MQIEYYEKSLTEEFNDMFSRLEHCDTTDQKNKIKEMNRLIDEMNENDFESAFTVEMFNEVHESIERNKLPIENAILFLKHIGYYQSSNDIWNDSFEDSLLRKQIKKKIINENKKQEEKSEKLLIDLSECYLLLQDQIAGSYISDALIPICMPLLLKAALNKEENNEVKNEVEIALLALSNFKHISPKQELYLNEIKEIIQHHQKHHNLSQLAYQSAWEFLIFRFYEESGLEGVIVNELHFARETERELDELTRNVDWTKMDNNGRSNSKEMIIIRWGITLEQYFFSFNFSWNDENEKLIECIVRICRAARNRNKKIVGYYMRVFEQISELSAAGINSLLIHEAFDFALEETHQTTLNDIFTRNLFGFFKILRENLKEDADKEHSDAKRISVKRKVCQKLEEDGYEDTAISCFEPIILKKASVQFVCLEEYLF